MIDHGATTRVQPDSECAYRVGQRVFGRHGLSREYFSGYVVSVDPQRVFPYEVDLSGSTVVFVLDSEIESDLPEAGASDDDLFEWLTGDDER